MTSDDSGLCARTRTKSMHFHLQWSGYTLGSVTAQDAGAALRLTAALGLRTGLAQCSQLRSGLRTGLAQQ